VLRTSKEYDVSEMLEREAATAIRLHHKNIVQFIGVSLTPQPLIVMELVNGKTLSSLILKAANKNKHRLPFGTKVHMLLQVVDGMIYLHNEKIVHRDLKPENILVSTDKDVKICDFGVSRSMAKTMTQVVGTARYMSPEVVLSGKYTTACDVYRYSE
jgi:serine/threonine protein kinase